MRRFSWEERDEIISLRKDGKSLFQICSAIKRGRSAVYYHLRKKFGRSYSLVAIDLSNQDLVGEVIGLFAADGSALPTYDYQIRFHLSINEEKYAKLFTLVLKKVFGKQPFLFRRSKYSTITLAYKSKVIYEFLKTYLYWNVKKTQSIMLKGLDYHREFLVGFLRGYFDGDGYYNDDRKLAQFVTTSKAIFEQLREILLLFRLQFSTRIYSDKRPGRHTAYYILLRKGEATSFIKLVNPRNPRRKRMGPP
jgi:hypothetical protein